MTEEEPPDTNSLSRNYNPRDLQFHSNGRAQSWRPVRLEEAVRQQDNKRFVRKVGTDRIYSVETDSKTGSTAYRCIDCDTPVEYIMVSRDIIHGTDRPNTVHCEPHHYCPQCEPLIRIAGGKEIRTIPERLPAIKEEDLRKPY